MIRESQNELEKNLPVEACQLIRLDVIAGLRSKEETLYLATDLAPNT